MTSFKLRRTEKSAQYLCAINDLTHHEFCDGNLCCSEISTIPIEIEKVPKLLPFQTGEGAEGGWGDAEPPQTKTVSLLPGWGGCRVVSGGVNSNTSNLVAMITSKEGGYKALHFQSCSNDYKCERMV